MTDSLEAIRERNAKRTPGPWEEVCIGSEGYVVRRKGAATIRERGRRIARVRDGAWDDDRADAEFIAHAPEAIDWLIAEVDRLRSALANAQDPDTAMAAVAMEMNPDAFEEEA